MLKKIKFKGITNAEFFPTLRERVDAYFAENKISKHANGAMIFKTIFILTVYYGCYAVILADMVSPLAMLGLAMICGFFAAFIGFCISHDAVHGAYSANARVNHILSYTFDLLGANAYMWNIMHNIVHHTHTNIPGHDEDLEPAPIIRLSTEKELFWYHRFQPYYAPLLYSLASFSWVFIKDFKKFSQKNIGSFIVKAHPRSELVKMICFKSIYYFMFLGLPFWMIQSVSWPLILLGFIAMHLTEGLTLGLVFQLAHVVEGTDFPLPDEKMSLENTWAVHQMHTTANFSRSSSFANFFLGGLNFQIEHHLFPKICHIHYRAISEIVKTTAEEFDIPYIENKTFVGAIGSHLRMLKKLGTEKTLAVAEPETVQEAELIA